MLVDKVKYYEFREKSLQFGLRGLHARPAIFQLTGEQKKTRALPEQNTVQRSVIIPKEKKYMVIGYFDIGIAL